MRSLLFTSIFIVLSSSLLRASPAANTAGGPVKFGIGSNIVEATDAAGILHAHQILNRIHVYQMNPGQSSTYKSSAVSFAIDAHHLITTYLFVAPTVMDSNLKVFLSTPTGLAEIYPQYVDIFNGLTLLYSPTELKSYLNLNNVSQQKIEPNELLKIVSPTGDGMDRTPAVFSGTANDNIRLVYSLKSQMSSNGSQLNGSLVVDSLGRIVGVYQGRYYTSDSESLTPSQAFLYLVDKALKSPIYHMDLKALRVQLYNQIKSYQAHVISVFETAAALPPESLDNFSISSIPAFFKCEKREGIESSVSCSPRLPLYALEAQPAVDVRAKFKLISGGAEYLAGAIDSESKVARDFFKGKESICRQQAIRFDFASDSQLHFCTTKSDLMSASFDTLIRGSTVNSKKTNLYFEFLIRDLSNSATTKTASLLVNSIRNTGGK